MPKTTKWNGAPMVPADRIETLTKQGRNCEARSGCTKPATEELSLQRADGNFIALAGADTVLRRTCDRHRRCLAENGAWRLVETREL